METTTPRAGLHGATLAGELPPDDFDPADEPSEPSDWEPLDVPCTDDDTTWEVFIPDDDEEDPLPDPGDFWFPGSAE